MNPIRWIRWKVVFVLAALFLVVWFIGVDQFLLKAVNSSGRDSKAARWSVADLALGLLGGDVKLQQLLVATPQQVASDASTDGAATVAAAEAQGAETDQERVFAAERLEVNTSMVELLRGRYVLDEVIVHVPRLTIERRPDGSTNVGDLGEAEAPEEVEPPKESTDWLEVVKKWHERLEKWKKRLPKGDGEDEEAEEEAGGETETDRSGGFADYSKRAKFPFAQRAGVVARTVELKGLQIDFADDDSGKKLPPLVDAEATITGLSSRPSVHDSPTQIRLRGKIAGAEIRLDTDVDLRGAANLFKFSFDAEGLPAALVEAFVGESLPVSLREGLVSLRADIKIEGDSVLEVTPRLALKGVQVATKDGHDRVAGFPAEKFVGTLNDASSELDELVIDDLRITGSLRAPRFEWGQTLQDLIVMGGQAFARKQIAAGVARGQELLGREGEKIREQLEKSGLPKGLKDGLKEIGEELPEAGESLEKAAGGLLKRGLFGDREDDSEKK